MGENYIQIKYTAHYFIILPYGDLCARVRSCVCAFVYVFEYVDV